MSEPVEFTAVISCYFEERTIREFLGRLIKAFKNLGRPFEIVVTNDGSTDKTFSVLSDLFEQYKELSVAQDLFRNFGQAAGLTAGICEARGKHFVFIDSDLQLDPEELPRLVAEFDKGNHVVTGYRADRRDPLLRRIASKPANLIMRRVARANLRDFGCTYKVINGDLLRSFEYGPHKVFNPTEVIRHAGRVVEVPVSHKPRPVGRSGWTIRKLLDFNMEHVVNLTDRPFQYAALAAIGLALLVVARIFVGVWIPRSILSEVSNGLLLNVMVGLFLIEMAVLCIIGELTIRTFRAVQRNPRFIVRERLRKPFSEPGH